MSFLQLALLAMWLLPLLWVAAAYIWVLSQRHNRPDGQSIPQAIHVSASETLPEPPLASEKEEEFVRFGPDRDSPGVEVLTRPTTLFLN